MTEWHTPQFEEIRMDAEINCYCSVLHDAGGVTSPRQPEARATSVVRPGARTSS